MLEILNDSFQHFLDQGDPRVKEWPMMKTPFPGIAMIAAYIYFVKVAGPQFMEKRKPYELRTPMVLYNFLMVLCNLFVFLGIGRYGWFNGYSLKCQPVDYSNAIEAVRMAQFGYFFYLTKFIEFTDTIFFVLRKKYNQITSLHVIHHSIVPFSLWFGIKFAPGGHHSLFPLMNSLVHVIMYSYYGLAAMGEKYKKYLFWKKYMTYIQLAQFVVVIVHTCSLVINNCDSTYIFISLNFIHALLFFGLFLNFFVQTYINKSVKSNHRLSTSEKAEMCTKNHRISSKENGHSKIITNGTLKQRKNTEEKSSEIAGHHGNDICKNSVLDDSMATIGNFCMMGNNNKTNSTSVEEDSIDKPKNS